MTSRGPCRRMPLASRPRTQYRLKRSRLRVSTPVPDCSTTLPPARSVHAPDEGNCRGQKLSADGCPYRTVSARSRCRPIAERT